MGTVLSFSPRERRPIYTTHHHGSGTISTSNSASDFQLNNYAYEQINNAKNRENSKPMQYLNVPNQFQLQNGTNSVLFGSSNSNIVNNNLTTSSHVSSMDDRQSESARILSEKNAIEKNLKKHSLFINALSWKRLSSSHGKKKLDSNSSKNKSNITSGSFRPPTLTDTVHPMVVVNDKKKYPQQQVQLIASNNSNNIVTTNQAIPQNSTNFFMQGEHKNIIALDLQNANLQHHHQHIDKVASKMSIPVRPIQLTSNNVEHQQSSQAPRKTIIQVSALMIKFLLFFVKWDIEGLFMAWLGWCLKVNFSCCKVENFDC
jgi:cyclin-dependent kinase 5 activator 1